MSATSTNEPDPNPSLVSHDPESGKAPPPLPALENHPIRLPPIISTTPPPANLAGKPRAMRQVVQIVLSICLGVFLVEAGISLIDDSLITCFGIHALAGARATVFIFSMFIIVVVYLLIAIAPMIPRRAFIAVTLFNPMALLAVIPFSIYFLDRIQVAGLAISFVQVLLGLGVLFWAQGGLRVRWPLLPESRLRDRGFSWWNLGGFMLTNLLVLLPGVLVYLGLCAHLAVDHFSDGFLALRSDGLTARAKKYVRDDGKAIQLFPMAHIGEADFYRKVSGSFPSNALILMEGVSDDQNLLTNKLSYKRAATSLGLAEQQREFRPTRGQWVRADVDVAEFASTTIDFLNLVTLIHSKGLNAETLVPLITYSPPAHVQQQLLSDLLRKRNDHLVAEIRARLAEPENTNIVIPWGAAHMPEIAREIQKDGFRLKETSEYTAIRFGGAATGRKKNF